MKRKNMRYLLSGFTENTGVRVFAFEGVTEAWVRTAYSVTADLALARKHGIRVQELPLLCRGVLERRGESDDRRAFTFEEDEMTIHADFLRPEIESRKKEAAVQAIKRRSIPKFGLSCQKTIGQAREGQDVTDTLTKAQRAPPAPQMRATIPAAQWRERNSFGADSFAYCRLLQSLRSSHVWCSIDGRFSDAISDVPRVLAVE